MEGEEIAMTPKPTKGGKRPGSGRKPKPDKRVTRSISLPPESWAKLDDLAAKRGASRSEAVNGLITRKSR
jgi:hypothetical protein